VAPTERQRAKRAVDPRKTVEHGEMVLETGLSYAAGG
jgi:hypothetical protein